MRFAKALPWLQSWPKHIERQYQAWLSDRCIHGLTWTRSVMVLTYLSAACRGIYDQAHYDVAILLCLTTAFYQLPTWTAKHLPQHLGHSWLAVSIARHLSILFQALGWIPCSTACTISGRRGSIAAILWETVTQPFQQADWRAVVVARAVAFLTFMTLFARVDMKWPLVQSTALLGSSTLFSYLVDMHRRRLYLMERRASGKTMMATVNSAPAGYSSAPATADSHDATEKAGVDEDDILAEIAASRRVACAQPDTAVPATSSGGTAGAASSSTTDQSNDSADDAVPNFGDPWTSDEESDEAGKGAQPTSKYDGGISDGSTGSSSLLEGLEDGVVFCRHCGTDGSTGVTPGCPGCDGVCDFGHLTGEAYEAKARELDELNLALKARLGLGLCDLDFQQVHMAFPWSDPDDLADDAMSKLKDMTRDGCTWVLGSTIRRGSLLVALDVMRHSNSSSSSTLAPAGRWLDLLQLPRPKAGEDVFVQVGKDLTTFRWDDNTRAWVEAATPSEVTGRLSASPAIHSVASLAVVARGAGGSGSGSGSSISELCGLSAQLEVLSSEAFSAGSSNGPVLRARFQGQAIPVTIANAGEASSRAGSAEIQADGAEPRPQLHKLRVTLDLSILQQAAPGSFRPGLAMLEVWSGRLVVQQVPLLLLAPHQVELADELEGLCYDAAAASPGQLTANDGGLSRDPLRLISLLGACLGHLSTHQQGADAPGLSAAAAAAVDERLNELERTLLYVSVAEGRTHMARELLDGLTSTAAFSLDELFTNASDGNTLLHMAVASAKVEVIALVLQWCVRHGYRCAWGTKNLSGSTPLHIAALSSGTLLGNRILRRFPSARPVWSSIKDNMNRTPSDVARLVDRPSSSSAAKSKAQDKNGRQPHSHLKPRPSARTTPEMQQQREEHATPQQVLQLRSYMRKAKGWLAVASSLLFGSSWAPHQEQLYRTWLGEQSIGGIVWYGRAMAGMFLVLASAAAHGGSYAEAALLLGLCPAFGAWMPWVAKCHPARLGQAWMLLGAYIVFVLLCLGFGVVPSTCAKLLLSVDRMGSPPLHWLQTLLLFGPQNVRGALFPVLTFYAAFGTGFSAYFWGAGGHPWPLLHGVYLFCSCGALAIVLDWRNRRAFLASQKLKQQ